jgi:molecular chaperone DnaK (HSP70)
MLLLNEPTAAAIKYLFSNSYTTNSTSKLNLKSDYDNDGSYLIFDFGGGTLDVSIVDISKKCKNFQVIGTGGNTKIGVNFFKIYFKFFF